MHDSLAPLSGGIAMVNMLVSAIWGGIGCGLQQFIVYLLLGVFLAGLMTGRTPELFGRKLETPQVRLLALLVLLQPITLLVFTAIALAVPGLAGTSIPASMASARCSTSMSRLTPTTGRVSKGWVTPRCGGT